MSAELQQDNYHGSETIRLREREIIDRWNFFLAMLHQKEKELAGLKQLTTLIRDMDTLFSELKLAEVILLILLSKLIYSHLFEIGILENIC